MIYKSLAHGEGELHRRFPNIPPRHIDGHLAPEIRGQLERKPGPAGQVEAVSTPLPDVARGWGVAGHRFEVLMSRVVP
jgi:hypothetical protein